MRMAGFQAFYMIFVAVFVSFPHIHGRGEWRDNFYEYTVKDINGKRIKLEKYRGTPSLVVNVASDCGYTDEHYRDLVRISKDPNMEGRLNVLAFPCNQFGYQEPGSDREIKWYVKSMYDVEFPLFSKVDVIGFDADPAWEYLTTNANQEPSWNFWKFLVDSDGYVKGAWGPETSVDSIYTELLTEAAMAMPRHRYFNDHFDDEF